jgi:hypothetical protein
MQRTAADIMAEAAETFRERNKIYGDNYKQVGGAMEAMFPNGVTLRTPEDHNRFHLFMLAIVKMTRYANNWEQGHQDSIRDATVYCAMLESIDEAAQAVREAKSANEPYFDGLGSR